MSYLYHFGIAFYTLLIRCASLFSSKAREWIHGRKGWKVNLDKDFNPGDKIAWFHAASLGEFEQGRPVMEKFRERFPEYKILLTFFSPSGYRQKKDYEGADKIMYLPPDFPGNVKYFISSLKPSVAIFIKYEFWYNYLSELDRRNIPVIFISSLFRKGQAFFHWYGGWFRKRLRRIDHFFVQDESSLKLLKSIGIENVTVSGDTRFDRVADILDGKKENLPVENFCKSSKVLLAGSTWPPDEEVLSVLPESFPNMKIIIAPHEVREDRIRQLIVTLKVDAARYTRDDPSTWASKQLLVIDTIGILSSIYHYADIAFVGGGFASGLHNIQEPAVNGMPVIFGPKYHKFREAAELIERGGAFTISSKDELQYKIGELLSNETHYKSACDNARFYMQENRGATVKILEGLKNFLA